MMKQQTFLKLILLITGVSILLPIAVLLLWSVTGRWPWPNLLPESYTLRTLQELFFGSAKLPDLLLSSITLAAIVAFLATVVGILTARATEFYDFKGKSFVRIGSFLPLLVPGTVFAMGIQITLIRLGLSDTLVGVVIVHLIAAVPYCITIMTDVTRAVGQRMEEQAMVLGAGPFTAFFQVTLPALLPGILSSMSMGFILSYSQYFSTLLIGGGRVKTLALVLVPYIQSGDRALSAVYSVVFVGSALLIFFLFEALIHHLERGEETR
ncbi:MAG: ABC transporter permease subunit [Oscillospiraceae bacterium]|nr:ABC transporter permease subunit [Oscillospiraceae bacterium]